jgi:hypothetical protein
MSTTSLHCLGLGVFGSLLTSNTSGTIPEEEYAWVCLGTSKFLYDCIFLPRRNARTCVYCVNTAQVNITAPSLGLWLVMTKRPIWGTRQQLFTSLISLGSESCCEKAKSRACVALQRVEAALSIKVRALDLLVVPIINLVPCYTALRPDSRTCLPLQSRNGISANIKRALALGHSNVVMAGKRSGFRPSRVSVSCLP